MWADIREGGEFIWQRRSMLWLLALFTIANLVIAFTIIQRPLMVKFNLAADWSSRGFTFETALALLSSLAGIGGVAGGFIISTWGGLRQKRVYGVIVPMIVTGIAQMVYGASPWLYLTAGAAALWGAMIPILNSHSQAIWQTATPRELQGRVFSVRRVIAQFTIPLGTLLGGSAGGLFDPGIAMSVAGGFMVLFAISQLFNPALIHIERPQTNPQLEKTQPVRHSAAEPIMEEPAQ
jgi:predicted MFS family arabinose efflux permease